MRKALTFSQGTGRSLINGWRRLDGWAAANLSLAISVGMLAAAALALTFSLSAMVRSGDVLPFSVAIALTAGSCGALAMHIRGRMGAEHSLQLAVAAMAGAYLTFMDPQPADFGLAILLGVALIAARLFRKWDGDTSHAEALALSDLCDKVLGASVRFAADGSSLSASAGTSNLLGCQRFELDGVGLFERVHVLDRPAFRKAVSDGINQGETSTLELRARRDADGDSRYIWIELHLVPVMVHADGTSEVLGVLRDISVRKDAALALERARQEAVDASVAKSRFLATIGHELRTPLNAIVGFSDMMIENIGGELSPTHKDYAGHIRQSGHHLLEVVTMLLDMSKIEAGKFEVNAELFSPRALVEPCFQMVDKLAKDQSVSIVADIPERLPELFGDERACRQIVINLLSNAVKFSSEGSTVSLSMRRQGKMLNISVADTGIGMSAETVRRIGEPFLQAQNGLARQYEGTGLGLSIVKGLVSLHDGRFSVMSEQGVGTTVTVLLPLDGPGETRPPAPVELLHKQKRQSDENKWLQDERKSAAQ